MLSTSLRHARLADVVEQRGHAEIVQLQLVQPEPLAERHGEDADVDAVRERVLVVVANRREPDERRLLVQDLIDDPLHDALDLLDVRARCPCAPTSSGRASPRPTARRFASRAPSPSRDCRRPCSVGAPSVNASTPALLAASPTSCVQPLVRIVGARRPAAARGRSASPSAPTRPRDRRACRRRVARKSESRWLKLAKLSRSSRSRVELTKMNSPEMRSSSSPSAPISSLRLVRQLGERLLTGVVLDRIELHRAQRAVHGEDQLPPGAANERLRRRRRPTRSTAGDRRATASAASS